MPEVERSRKPAEMPSRDAMATLSDLLLAMPCMGDDADFERHDEHGRGAPNLDDRDSR